MVLVKQRQSLNWLIIILKKGKKVIIAAGDTFRAAAADQLSILG